MNKVLKYSLIVIMIISLVSNLFLLFVIGSIETDWQSVYDTNEIEWCEFMNDYIRYSNNLIIELRYNDEAYNEIETIDETDCWAVEW